MCFVWCVKVWVVCILSGIYVCSLIVCVCDVGVYMYVCGVLSLVTGVHA